MFPTGKFKVALNNNSIPHCLEEATAARVVECGIFLPRCRREEHVLQAKLEKKPGPSKKIHFIVSEELGTGVKYINQIRCAVIIPNYIGCILMSAQTKLTITTVTQYS